MFMDVDRPQTKPGFYFHSEVFILEVWKSSFRKQFSSALVIQANVKVIMQSETIVMCNYNKLEPALLRGQIVYIYIYIYMYTHTHCIYIYKSPVVFNFHLEEPHFPAELVPVLDHPFSEELFF